MKKTIMQVCKELEKKLLAITCLERFYIGETDDKNLQITTERHEKEGYSTTTPLATAHHEIISKAEEQLIAFFQNSNLQNKLGNRIPYSVGSEKANIIYVSIRTHPQQDIELDDDNINWPEVYQLTK